MFIFIIFLKTLKTTVKFKDENSRTIIQNWDIYNRDHNVLEREVGN